MGRGASVTKRSFGLIGGVLVVMALCSGVFVSAALAQHSRIVIAISNATDRTLKSVAPIGVWASDGTATANPLELLEPAKSTLAIAELDSDKPESQTVHVAYADVAHLEDRFEISKTNCTRADRNRFATSAFGLGFQADFTFNDGGCVAIVMITEKGQSQSV